MQWENGPLKLCGKREEGSRESGNHEQFLGEGNIELSVDGEPPRGKERHGCYMYRGEEA